MTALYAIAIWLGLGLLFFGCIFGFGGKHDGKTYIRKDADLNRP